MSIKEKILDALDATSLEDIAEDSLLDILLADYAAKRRRIADLERQQAGIQLAAQRDTEALLEERHRMRTDPLYTVRGEYFFELPKQGLEGRRFVVRATGDRIDLCERLKGYDFMARQVSREDFNK